MPQEAETITVGAASSIRAASSWLANPPNTTEWTAPRRAAGQHRDDRLGDHRQVEHHPVAPCQLEIAEDTGETCCLVEQFAVGVGALGIGDRGVVDRGQLVAANGDMSVQRIGAGVQFSVWEPAVERGVVVIEDALGFRFLRDGLCRFGPERGRIRQAGLE